MKSALIQCSVSSIPLDFNLAFRRLPISYECHCFSTRSNVKLSDHFLRAMQSTKNYLVPNMARLKIGWLCQTFLTDGERTKDRVEMSPVKTRKSQESRVSHRSEAPMKQWAHELPKHRLRPVRLLHPPGDRLFWTWVAPPTHLAFWAEPVEVFFGDVVSRWLWTQSAFLRTNHHFRKSSTGSLKEKWHPPGSR